MSYIGSTPTTQSFIAGTDYFNGTGSQTAFTLSRSVVSVNDIEVVINNVEQQPNTAYTVSGTTITFTSAPSAGTANIYVRYLSTTTQSITPSQNTVSYSTLNSDNQSKLGISFKNRIINGAMVINQRGFSGAVDATNPYTLDRWQGIVSQANKFTISQNAGSVTPPVGFTNYLGVTSSSAYSVTSGDYFVLNQPIEGYNCADLGWGTANAKTVTLSFQVYSSLTGTFGGVVRNNAGTRSYPFTYSISAANTWQQVSITVPGDQTGSWPTTNGGCIDIKFGLGVGSTYSGTAGAWAGALYLSATGATSVVGTNGATFYITGVQLEVGTQATTFDNRSIGTELALCQRYLFAIRGSLSGGGGYGAVGVGCWDGASGAAIDVFFPVQMRDAPASITVSSASHFSVVREALAWETCTAIALSTDNVGVTACAIGANTATRDTRGFAARMRTNSTSAYLGFNAEL